MSHTALPALGSSSGANTSVLLRGQGEKAFFPTLVCSVASPSIDFEWIGRLQSHDAVLNQFKRGEKPTAMKLAQVKILNTDTPTWCDTGESRCRPYIPEAAQPLILKKLHGLSHPGARATSQLVGSKYVWPNVDKTCREFYRSCITCQANKVHQHNKVALEKIAAPDSRFQHVHIDIVGPLPTVKGYSYQFLTSLGEAMWKLRAPDPSHHDTKGVFHRDTKLDNSSHAFVRVDAVKAPLQAPYTGPYRIVRHGLKTCTLDINGMDKEISVDRLKTARIDRPPTPLDSIRATPAADEPQLPADIVQPTSPPQPARVTPSSPQPPITSRCGRTIRPPARFD